MAIVNKCPRCGQPTNPSETKCKCGFDFGKWKNAISLLGVAGALAGLVLARAASGAFGGYTLAATVAGFAAGTVVGILMMRAKAR